jgi:hypothetical protein
MTLVAEASEAAVAGGLLAAVALRDPVQSGFEDSVQGIRNSQDGASAARNGVEHDDADLTSRAPVQRTVDVVAAEFHPFRSAFEQGVEQ